MSVKDMMTAEQRQRLSEPLASLNPKLPVLHPVGQSPFAMTGHFHMLMGLPSPEAPIVPPVSDRNLRANLIFEEFQELLDAMGFQIMLGQAPVRYGEELRLEHKEGSHYDLVETADALGDLNVVVNGTGVSFGIPMHFIDYEVYASNMSKTDDSGNPIINVCAENCADAQNGINCWHLPMVDAPIGKRLKGPNFVPPNIPRILLAFENKEI